MGKNVEVFFILAGYLGKTEVYIKNAGKELDAKGEEQQSHIATTADICQARSFMKQEWCEDWIKQNMPDKAGKACKIITKKSNIFYQ